MKLRSKGSALHARAELIIPWLVNGSLPPDEESEVRRHIAGCAQCQADYEEQLRVREAMCAEGPLVFAAESSYQKLLARMQSTEPEREARPEWEPRPERESRAPIVPFQPRRAARPFREAPPVVRWLAAAVILQAFALGVGAWAWHSSGGADRAPYSTLTSASPAYESGPRVRIVFKPDLSMGTLQTLLQGAGAHIVDGPADGGVYTLGFARSPDSAAALGKRLASLRADPAVLFAEPVQDGVR